MKLPFEGCILKEQPVGSITQLFGGNLKLYKPFNMKGHNGIDLVGPHGTPLIAIQDGTVVEVKNSPNGYGKHLRYITDGDGVCNEWTYGHCDSIFVKVGDRVTTGLVIATMGNTGFVVSGKTPFWNFNPYAGTHLHLGLRKVKKNGKGWSYPGSNIKIDVLNYDNGYLGSIDPLPEFNIHTTPTISNLETQVTLLQRVLELYKQLKNYYV